ncbi:efflux RND transporter permease subunit [Roseomonas sp. GC11]|uniref:efflux RND transporter permease subunit n=1 Tax=Roseomonas sp. GC11 TaxID=2950546 RepID=UPI00210B5E0D|nr:efflux RND transporter permease subunit [Roseomonas sp. GC11]MCQ4159369.1 efflux RND transporter permease subunit [Roseomonas sp. GC11]
MSRFFISRPVFAWVLAITVMLGGLLGLRTLPIAQYPSIAPPAISISATYAGASAETIQNTVVQVIEQQMSGLDGLIYFSAESTKTGTATITLTFAQGTDPDIAQVQVQNKLQLATPRLPQTVQQAGVRVAKATTNFLMVVGFYSPDGSLSNADIGDYIASTVQDPLSRTAGVGDYQLFGAQYAMRIWLDPAKLNSYSMTTGDVSSAITAQNVQIASGELGGQPQVPGQQLNATIIGPSYLQTPEQFGGIVLKVNSDGSQVRLRDVARIELGSQDYSSTSYYNGSPAAGLGIKLASGANALDTARAVRATIDSLRPTMPAGMEVAYPYDTTPFISISIEGVVEALVEAIILVFLVMLLFLQNIRATFIATLTVPVVLLGTFGILAAAGYSINVLTMFAMVLAIGLLVDDAIVVIENVERVMAEDHLSPLEATRRSMGQISGALVGVALVLSAVFVPMAFFGGSAGVIYRQFSITIVSAMGLSVLVALIFTPALCATLLKPHSGPRRGFFGLFNRGFDATTRAYGGGVGRVLRGPFRYLVLYAAVVAGMALLFVRLPTSFLPDEDQGMMFVQVATPPGATQERTQRALDDLRAYLLRDEGAAVQSVFTIAGFSFSGRGQNAGMAFVSLKHWDERKNPALAVQAVAGRVMGRFAGYRDAMVFSFAPPAIPELGNATGFDFQLQAPGGLSHEQLLAARNQMLGMAAQSPVLMAVRPNNMDDEPQYHLEVDWERASALGLTISDVTATINAALGSTYVNDFLDRGRVKRVYMQGVASARMQPEDLGKWYVRNSSGDMVPFSAFATARWGYGAPKLDRYNGIPAMNILGQAAPGRSTGEAMAEMERIFSTLPPGFTYAWNGLSFQEKQTGSQTMALYAISVLIVFLCLAALYESWAVPVAVLLVVPLGIVGAVIAVYLRGLGNDVYFQVGLLTTVGLAAKNAILIVEFAKEGFDRGSSLAEAALHAAQQRLRPIIMTSLAFILGCVPLAISHGAGSGAQNAIGTGVVGGMTTGTLLAIFFVPLFFVVVLKLFRVKPAHLPAPQPEPHHPALPAAGE